MRKKIIKPAPLTSRTPQQPKEDAQQTMADVKSRGRPVGGVDEVKIPPLDAQPVTGPDGQPLTMHQQAESLRDPANPLSPFYDPNIAEHQRQQQTAQRAQMDPRALRASRHGQPAQQPPKGPFGGVLPPEAQADPNFRPGVGSMYANNQPGMQKPPARSGALSEESIEGLDALHKFNKEAAETQQKTLDEADQKQIDRNPAEELAAELGIENAAEFFEQFKAQVDKLDTPELRKAIEERCGELSIEQLIEEGELHQDVPIVRGNFVPTYRTVTGDEDLSIKRRMYGTQGGEQFLLDTLSMSHLTAGLYAINGRPLPSHLDDKKAWNEDLFKAKFRIVKSYPLAMLASLSLNFTWFDQRTRKLFVDIDPIKNG